MLFKPGKHCRDGLDGCEVGSGSEQSRRKLPSASPEIEDSLARPEAEIHG